MTQRKLNCSRQRHDPFCLHIFIFDCTNVGDVDDAFVPADTERFEGWRRSGLGVLAGQTPVLERLLSLRIVYGSICDSPGGDSGRLAASCSCPQNKLLFILLVPLMMSLCESGLKL